MKFCPECSSVMAKSTTATGAIVFRCRCQYTIDGEPDDTLMAEEYLEIQSNLKHDVFIENAPFDAAANIVMKDCPNCGLNFMVMIRVGANETTMYSCSCNFRATHAEYMKMISQGERKAENTVKTKK